MTRATEAQIAAALALRSPEVNALVAELRALRADADIARAWFAAHYGQDMAGKDFATTCPIATAKFDELIAGIKQAKQLVELLHGETHGTH